MCIVCEQPASQTSQHSHGVKRVKTTKCTSVYSTYIKSATEIEQAKKAAILLQKQCLTNIVVIFFPFYSLSSLSLSLKKIYIIYKNL